MRESGSRSPAFAHETEIGNEETRQSASVTMLESEFGRDMADLK